MIELTKIGYVIGVIMVPLCSLVAGVFLGKELYMAAIIMGGIAFINGIGVINIIKNQLKLNNKQRKGD